MPWKPYPARKKTENNPTTRDIWLAIRQIQNVQGAMACDIASIALTVNRSDNRIEHVVAELTGLLGRLEDAAAAAAELASLVDREGA